MVFAYLSDTKTEYTRPVPPPEYEEIFFSSAPSEIVGMATKHGLEKMHHISTRSISHFEDNINELSDEEFQKYMEQLYLNCEDDGAAGNTTLWIGRKV